jgi:hypothetical protein
MILRWAATAVREASTKFRRVAGHESMPRLVRIRRAETSLNEKRAPGKNHSTQAGERS